MSNITYDRNKVEAFKLAFATYKTAKTSFTVSMEQFREVIEFMEEGTNINLAPKQENSGEDYVINDKGILIQKQTQTPGSYDSSVNSVVDVGEYKAFVTNVKYQAGNVASVAETNKLYQVGLEDLEYNDTSENTVNKYYNIDIYPEITTSGDCNMGNLFQCSARAKMKNKQYYGIEGGTDSTKVTSICDCYIFDEIPDNEVTERLRTVEFNDISNAYLATLMDGSLYQIKEDSFSDNYDGFYSYSSTSENNKISRLIDGEEDDTLYLNPFVGNGINNINITQLGDNCGRI